MALYIVFQDFLSGKSRKARRRNTWNSADQMHCDAVLPLKCFLMSRDKGKEERKNPSYLREHIGKEAFPQDIFPYDFDATHPL